MQHLPDADEYGSRQVSREFSPDVRYDDSSLTKIEPVMYIILLKAVGHACVRNQSHV